MNIAIITSCIGNREKLKELKWNYKLNNIKYFAFVDKLDSKINGWTQFLIDEFSVPVFLESRILFCSC